MNHPAILASHKKASTLLEELKMPLQDRTGFVEGNPLIVPCYFAYMSGIKGNVSSYREQLNTLKNHTFNIKRPTLSFQSGIPTAPNRELISAIQLVFQKVAGNALNQVEVIVSEILNASLLSSLDISSDALVKVLKAYLHNQTAVSETQLRNFTTKLISWYVKYAHGQIQSFYQQLHGDVVYNPLLVYFGKIKNHTEYFLYLCWLSGMDVVYINTSRSDHPSVLNQWAQVIEWDQESVQFEYPDWKSETKTQVVRSTKDIKLSASIAVSAESLKTDALPAVIKYRDSDNLFDDFPTYISNRSGFIRGEMPILPVYFYRVIGIQTDQNFYFNELFKLDRKLKSFGESYIRFENHIPLANDTVFLKAFSKVWQDYQTAHFDDLDALLEALSNVSAFPLHHKAHYRKLLIYALKATTLEYITESNVNSIGQIKNLIMKLLMWTQQHLVLSLNAFDFVHAEAQNTCNPKILYYGNIKKHEAYFLLFASRLGADIICFNTYENTPWDTLLIDNLKRFTVQFPDQCRVQPFPVKEIHMRSETVAYQASKEIESVLFNPEDGLFKPWQLDPFKIKAIGLKSTLEEAQTLWPIEARLREHFEVKEDTVYVPNLFFKLSGMYADHNTYWKLMASFADEKLVKIVDHLPFTSENYSKTDEYLVNYIFNAKGLLDIKEVRKKQIYKYSHLKNATQTLILETINHVLTSKAYKEPLTTHSKKSIILALLNLSNDLLNMIASYDKPFHIPKLMVFDPDENMFSESDIAILLFLHLIGFDIAIFTPTGYNNIENVIKANYFDIYKLEEVDFNLQLPDLNRYKTSTEKGKSFFSSLFGN